jgi:L-threonylcarbamoyladenylate synthase
MAEAVARLRAGRLVAFPTETVYGLGANALDAEAVAGIFAAKGRPSTNPLIVHVPDADAARRLAGEWPPVADTLAARFWPGPLTVVVEKAADVPRIVTAGGPTVGLRVPDHPVALELLRASGVPVAAPSANRSEEVSPTTAQHVADSLGPWVDDLLILDGGPTRVGIESTVLDVTGDTPRILRPGMVSAMVVAEVTGSDTGQSEKTPDEAPARAPGQMMRHYAPRVPVNLITAKNERLRFVDLGKAACEMFDSLTRDDIRSSVAPFGYLSIDSHFIADKPFKVKVAGGRGIWIPMPTTPEDYAAFLYAALRELDNAGVSHINVEEPPHSPGWEAIHDRLRRAAAPKSASPPLPSLGEGAGGEGQDPTEAAA